MRAQRLLQGAVVAVSAVAVVGVATVVDHGTARADCLPMKAIAANYAQTYGIRTDGTLWHWGASSLVTGRAAPALPDVATDVTQVATGGHTLVRRADGTVWAWGANDEGQLGDGEDEVFYRPFPLPVLGLPPTTKVGVGQFHSVALANDKTVWTWGWNYKGQLGDGTHSSHYEPAQLAGLSGIKDIAVGQEHALAIRSDGRVLAWGDNQFGQIGDGTQNNQRPSPTLVNTVTSAVAVVADQTESLALKSDGTVWEWGSGFSPRQISGLTTVTAIAAGPDGDHFMALKQDGSVWAWGINTFGQLGDGTTNPSLFTPVRVTGLPQIKAIAASAGHSVALDVNGRVWAWGRNTNGQLGDGTTTERHNAVQADEFAQCYVPDVQEPVSPSPLPTVSPVPTVSPPTPPTLGGDPPVADCTFYRGSANVVFGGYALSTGNADPLTTRITCTVSTPLETYESTVTLPGRTAATAATHAMMGGAVTVCTYAEATYPGGAVATTNRCVTP